jgi:hypothetical protein
MAYIKKNLRGEQYQRDKDGLIRMADVFKRRPDESFFYEIEAAVVIDIIYGPEHPLFSTNTPNVDVKELPNSPTKPESGEVDYSWIGRARVRPLESMQRVDVELLPWAMPMEGASGFNEPPVIGEVVLVAKYMDRLYYTRKLNLRGFASANADFRLEVKAGTAATASISTGKNSEMGPADGKNVGKVGRYMVANNQIRSLLPYEGDTIVESRHGQSIRMGAYDSVRANDGGKGTYSGGYGNPMILIRNRQRAPKADGMEKNASGKIIEDINQDGSLIFATSGLTKILGERGWKNPVAKTIFEDGKEEKSAFSPTGATRFKWTPDAYADDQVLIQSGRLLFVSKENETVFLSKKRFAIATDDEITLDAAGQVVFTSNKLTALNSPYIFLGDYGVTEEPIVLGRSLVVWLADLISWLKNHQHIYDHKHGVINHSTTTGPTPQQTQVPPQPDINGLNMLANALPLVLSERVFTVKGPPS